MNLLSVYRRDEGLVQQAIHFGSDAVSFTLRVAHVVAELVAQLQVRVVLNQQDTGARALNDVGVALIERLKKIAFAAQQFTEKHRSLSFKLTLELKLAPRVADANAKW